VRGLALSFAAALAAAACSTTKSQEQSDWERRNPQTVATEEAPDPPAYPAAKNLLEFSVIGADGFRFYIDPRAWPSARKDWCATCWWRAAPKAWTT